MTNATHNGTCQYCGRQHAVSVKTGKLAKHGYQVLWNSFMGTCGASGERPLQVERTLTDEYIVDLNAMAAKEIAYADALTPDTHGLMMSVHNDLNWEVRRDLEKGLRVDSDDWLKVRNKQYTKAEALALGCTEERWAEQTARVIKGTRARAAQKIAFAKELGELADRIHGTALLERAEASKPVRVQQFFSWPEKASAEFEGKNYSPSYALYLQMKAEGRKPTHRRPNYGRSVVVTYDKKEGE